MNEEIWYEFRTSRVKVAMFASKELAMEWINSKKEQNPSYANALKLYKIVKYTIETEVVDE